MCTYAININTYKIYEYKISSYNIYESYAYVSKHV